MNQSNIQFGRGFNSFEYHLKRKLPPSKGKQVLGFLCGLLEAVTIILKVTRINF